jgi:hypothetical protein
VKPDEAYAYAWQHADRNADGSRVQSSMVDLLAANIDYDLDEAKRRLAQRVIASRKRSGQTVAAGAVVSPGMEPYAYEPHRLLDDGAGNVVENQHARPAVKQAEWERSRLALSKAADRADRDGAEVAEFDFWAAQQHEAGRDPAEVTWGKCVREFGLHKDVDVEADPSDEDGA